MARPTKQGIDYFPLDCQFDEKIEMLLIEKGATGLGVLITIWQMIYINEGYYINNNKDLHLLIKRKIDVDINEVSECINICLGRQIFSETLHNKHGVLTSKAIQKRFFDAAKKKKGVNALQEYLLINVNSYENIVYSSLNPVKDSDNSTKEKEEEEVKVKIDFDEFWSAYPKGDRKKDSKAKWNKLSLKKQELALADCQTRYLHTEKRFIPAAAAYLNGERWTDDPIENSQNNGFPQISDQRGYKEL